MIKRFISKYIIRRSPIGIWKKRAKQYGARAVLNIGHSIKQIDAVTEMQKEEIFPFLKQLLTGHEKTVLDFGCGPGRFTGDLAQIIQGRAVGVDPIQHLLDLAKVKNHTNVEYRLMDEGVIPMENCSFDIIWVCLVLGGIIEENTLRRTVLEMKRVLKKRGLIVLIENTTEKESADYWRFRSVEEYQLIFDFVTLRHLSDYYDLGERVSIMAGRMNDDSP